VKVEEIVRKIRALPIRLRFHLLFALYIAPDLATGKLSILETYGEMLATLAGEINELPLEISQILVASEMRNLVL
jgi:hypothetical protein